ncbi:MAG: hypothetical protein ACJ739_13395 [Acidimicrobiales bacterium]
MPIAGVVAGALCAFVGWMVVTHGLRATQQERHARHASDRALVGDCLANVDRVIDLPALERAGLAPVIDLRTFEPSHARHLIDLSDVRPRNAAPAPLPDTFTLEPPSIWRAPRTPAPRSAAATA